MIMQLQDFFDKLYQPLFKEGESMKIHYRLLRKCICVLANLLLPIYFKYTQIKQR